MTIDTYRRKVSQFYFHLADLRRTGILPETIIYTDWSTCDLDIIPKIIVPLDVAQNAMSDVGDQMKSRAKINFPVKNLKKIV